MTTKDKDREVNTAESIGVKLIPLMGLHYSGKLAISPYLTLSECIANHFGGDDSIRKDKAHTIAECQGLLRELGRSCPDGYIRLLVCSTLEADFYHNFDYWQGLLSEVCQDFTARHEGTTAADFFRAMERGIRLAAHLAVKEYGNSERQTDALAALNKWREQSLPGKNKDATDGKSGGENCDWISSDDLDKLSSWFRTNEIRDTFVREARKLTGNSRAVGRLFLRYSNRTIYSEDRAELMALLIRLKLLNPNLSESSFRQSFPKDKNGKH